MFTCKKTKKNSGTDKCKEGNNEKRRSCPSGTKVAKEVLLGW